MAFLTSTFQRNGRANCSLVLLACKDISHKVNLDACNKHVSKTSTDCKVGPQLEKSTFFLFDADVNGYILVLDRSVQNADCGLQTEYKKRFVLFNVVVVEEM